jgi:hypothetical protein
MQRTLERELKVPETATGEAIGRSHTEKRAQTIWTFEVGEEKGRKVSSTFAIGGLGGVLSSSDQRGLGGSQKGGSRKHFVRVWIRFSR